jgi:hypothetical protein
MRSAHMDTAKYKTAEILQMRVDFAEYYYGNEIEDTMGEICSTHGRNDKLTTRSYTCCSAIQ